MSQYLLSTAIVYSSSKIQFNAKQPYSCISNCQYINFPEQNSHYPANLLYLLRTLAAAIVIKISNTKYFTITSSLISSVLRKSMLFHEYKILQIPTKFMKLLKFSTVLDECDILKSVFLSIIGHSCPIT